MTVYQSPVVVLQEQDVHALIVLLRKLRHSGARHGAPLTKELRSLLRNLENARDEMSHLEKRNERNQRNGFIEELTLTTEQVAQLTGYTTRTIQLRAHDFGGQKINGRYMFPTYLREEFSNEYPL